MAESQAAVNQAVRKVNTGGVKRIWRFVYDFAVDGGAIGSLAKKVNLPAKTLVTNILSYEHTALTSGGAATLQVKAGATNLTDALAYDTGFTGADTHALASSAEAVYISAKSELTLAIATAALTAGKVEFFVEGIEARE